MKSNTSNKITMRKIKINIVLGHELPFPQKKGGGVNSLISQIIEGFDKNKVDIAIYSPINEIYNNYEEFNGVKYYRLKGSKRKKNVFINILAGIPYALRVLIKMRKADVLFSHFWHGFLFSFSKKIKIKVHTVHRDPKKAIKFFTKFDKVYFGSDSVTEEAKLLIPTMKDKFETVYNCVDFTDYMKSENRIKDGKIKFLYIGRFSVDKGLESFIKGFEKSIKINNKIRFKTIGPLDYTGGSDEKYLYKIKNYIERKDLKDYINISGPIYDRSELDREIFNFDAVVLPSIYGETLNMVVLESMRIGRPLLISNLEANLPLLDEGITGYFCNKNDIDSWSHGILKLAEKIENEDFFGYKVHQYGLNKFSSKKIADVYYSNFIKLLFNER